MTREELKAHCKKQIEMCEMWAKAKGEKPCGKVYEEHKMILELLEEKPYEDWYDVPSGEMTLEQARQAVKDLREKLAEYLEQQPCEDVISRDCDKCAYYDDGANHEACDECFADEYEHPNFKPKAQPCEDCISRQAVLDGLASIAKVKARSDAQKSLMGRVIFFVEQLPSVAPKEKTGHWVKTPKAVMGEGYMWYCDKCEHQVYQDSSRDYPSEKYCPNCGAKMQEVENDTR